MNAALDPLRVLRVAALAMAAVKEARRVSADLGMCPVRNCCCNRVPTPVLHAVPDAPRCHS